MPSNTIITNEDFLLVSQRNKKIYTKLQFLNSSFKPINNLTGNIITGDISITSSSLIRKTLSLTININEKSSFLLKNKYTWFSNYLKLYVGFYSYMQKEIVYYNLGTFLVDSADASFDSSTNQISLSCIDLMGDLQETHHGRIVGSKNTVIKAGANIRLTIIDFIEKFTNIKDYYIDEICSYKDIEDEDTNILPYELEMDTSSVLDVITSLVELYPYYEAYIDEDGVFICRKMLSTLDEPVFITNDILSKYVISEKPTYPLTEIYNTVEVWGNSVDYDRYSDVVKLSQEDDGDGNISYIYNVTYTDFESLGNGNLYAFKIPEGGSNLSKNIRININNQKVSLTDNDPAKFPAATHPDKTEDGSFRTIDSGYLEEECVYVFKYKGGHFYLQGLFQVHAIAMLMNSEPDANTKMYYKEKFNCSNIFYRIEPDNEFSIERIGVKAASHSGGEFDNITSDYLGLERAKYELYKAKKTNEIISLEMLYIPFLSIGHKLEYQPMGESEPQQYMVTDIKADIQDGIMSTMTVSMTRFYDLFEQK